MQEIRIGDLTFYRFESEYVGTNMYLTFSDGEALIVDPHFDAQAEQMLADKNVSAVTVLLTHEHPDHTGGIPWLKDKFVVKIICQQKCADKIAVEKENRPYLITFILAKKDEENGTHLLEKFESEVRPYSAVADITFDDEFEYDWNGMKFSFKHTPGHAKGACCIKVNEEAVFTGDNLILNTPVITRFPGGSTKDFNAITKPYLDNLPDDILVLAGHGQVFKMKESR